VRGITAPYLLTHGIRERVESLAKILRRELQELLEGRRRRVLQLLVEVLDVATLPCLECQFLGEPVHVRPLATALVVRIVCLHLHINRVIEIEEVCEFLRDLFCCVELSESVIGWVYWHRSAPLGRVFCGWAVYSAHRCQCTSCSAHQRRASASDVKW
jgi:hypothetical protein